MDAVVIKMKKSLSRTQFKSLLSSASSIKEIKYFIDNDPPGGWPGNFHEWANTQEAFRILAAEKAEKIREQNYPADRFSGRGIIMCGGGPKYFPSLYVNTRMIRLLGCTLPIIVYYIGMREMDARMIALLEEFPDVKCVDGTTFEKENPIRIHAGWESKVYSIINCPFEEVLMLDSDNTCLCDPTFLFDYPEYKEKGAILWRDYDSPFGNHDETMWRILGMKYRDEPQIESGQVLVNKSKSWKEINMAKYFCDYSDYYFRLFYGDKETFHFGWRYMDGDYVNTPYPDWINNSIIVQRKLDGSWLFGHRAQAKFKMDKSHRIDMGFPFEQDTLELIDELGARWNGKIWSNSEPSEEEKIITKSLQGKKFKYKRVGIDFRDMKLGENNRITEGGDRLEREWHVFKIDGDYHMSIIGDEGLICLLKCDFKDEVWRGEWCNYEKCKIELIPYE
jgi:hypothetical protein